MRVARGVPLLLLLLLLLAVLVATRAQPSAQIAAVEGEERRVAISLIMLTCRSYLALDSSVAGQHTVNHNAVIYGK